MFNLGSFRPGGAAGVAAVVVTFPVGTAVVDCPEVSFAEFNALQSVRINTSTTEIRQLLLIYLNYCDLWYSYHQLLPHL